MRNRSCRKSTLKRGHSKRLSGKSQRKAAGLFPLFACLVSMLSSCSRPAYRVESPDGNLAVTVEIKNNPRPYLAGERAYYRIGYRGKAILVDSPLGLDFLNAKPLDHGFKVTGTARKSHDSTWENPFGAQRRVRDHYNQLEVSLREMQAPNRRVDLIFRAFNAGVAFRYFLPQQPALRHFTIAAENTGFYFAQADHAYALDIQSYTSAYESNYSHIPLDEIKPTSIVPLPLLIQTPNGPWAALLEADLTHYAGMYVGGVRGVSNALMSKLSPLPDHSDEAVIGSTPLATPWRVVMVNPTPGGLLESNDIILNLNPPCALADTSWIKPGKATFPWWSGFLGGHGSFPHNVNTAMFKYYIDFAARAHFRYIEVSDYWYKGPDLSVPEYYIPNKTLKPADTAYPAGGYIAKFPPDAVNITKPSATVNIQEVLKYAKRKGVKCLLWVDWPPLKRQMDVAIPLYEKWGAAGIKVDLMNRDDQEMVAFYHRVAKLAAAHHLIVYFHGAYKPTGLRRTYPNVLNREGVMGLEHDKVQTIVTPGYDVTLPFTRMLAGPFDYTPGSFHNATRSQFKPQFIRPMSQGTRAHELAKYVVFLAPLEMVSDDPDAYKSQPSFAFIEKVPTVWDKTVVLNGAPGKFVTIARENHGVWYLGSMTNWDARDIKVPLGFLGQGSYHAQIFADGPDADRVATSVKISKRTVNGSGQIDLHLAPGGGAAVIFTPGQ